MELVGVKRLDGGGRPVICEFFGYELLTAKVAKKGREDREEKKLGPRRRSRRKEDGVGNGNRTRNRRSHSPVLCQLSYSHR